MATNPQIILIDGPAGSGKTTLATKLQGELNCQVVHLDDIYDGWNNALSQTLSDKLLALVDSFLKGESFDLEIYNWHESKFDSSISIMPAPHLIIEGVGAGQSAIRQLAATLYWVEADPGVALQRVLDRDESVPEIEALMQRWRISEAKHFEAERTREFADFIITTT